MDGCLDYIAPAYRRREQRSRTRSRFSMATTINIYILLYTPGLANREIFPSSHLVPSVYSSPFQPLRYSRQSVPVPPPHNIYPSFVTGIFHFHFKVFFLLFFLIKDARRQMFIFSYIAKPYKRRI